MRAFVVTGFVLVATMQLIFLLSGGDRPAPYLEIQALSIVGSLVVAWGARRLRTPDGLRTIAIGLGINALTRLLQIALSMSRLPLTLNLALLAGFVAACIFAARWSALPTEARRADALRGALWMLAIVHFFSLLFAISRLNAAIGLALGTAGLALAAPNVRAAGPA